MKTHVKDLHALAGFLLKALNLALFCALLPILPANLNAEPENLPDHEAIKNLVLMAPDIDAANEFIDVFKRYLPNNFRLKIIKEKAAIPLLEKTHTIITLGRNSLVKASKLSTDITIVSTFITPAVFKNVMEEQQGSPKNIIPVYPIPDTGSQMVLASLLLPLAEQVGFLYSDESSALLEGVITASDSLELEIQPMHWQGNKNLSRLVNTLLKKSDYILAIEDSNIYNRNTAKTLLLTSYRQNKVVIGPNPSFVSAGSLATVYCSNDEVAKMVVRQIIDIQKTHAQTIECTSIAINEHVAKSLSISVPEDLEARLIDALGGKQP